MNDPRRRVGNRASEQNPAYSPLRGLRPPDPGEEAQATPPGLRHLTRSDGAAEEQGSDVDAGLVRELVQDLQRIPAAFESYQKEW